MLWHEVAEQVQEAEPPCTCSFIFKFFNHLISLSITLQEAKMDFQVQFYYKLFFCIKKELH